MGHGHAVHTDHSDHQGHQGHGHRTHRFDPANAERLIGEERRRLLPPEPTLARSGIAAGQTVVDLGCGPGFFSLPLAQMVGPAGRVYAVDVEPQMVAMCARRASEAGLKQVETVHSADSSVPLPDAIADRVFIAFVLHEANDPAAFLREARRLLRSGGAVTVVDWQKRDGPPGPASNHRLSPEEVAAAAVPAGLRAGPAEDLNEHHYLIRLDTD